MVQVGLLSGRVVNEACRALKEALPLCFQHMRLRWLKTVARTFQDSVDGVQSYLKILKLFLRLIQLIKI